MRCGMRTTPRLRPACVRVSCCGSFRVRLGAPWSPRVDAQLGLTFVERQELGEVIDLVEYGHPAIVLAVVVRHLGSRVEAPPCGTRLLRHVVVAASAETTYFLNTYKQHINTSPYLLRCDTP